MLSLAPNIEGTTSSSTLKEIPVTLTPNTTYWRVIHTHTFMHCLSYHFIMKRGLAFTGLIVTELPVWLFFPPSGSGKSDEIHRSSATTTGEGKSSLYSEVTSGLVKFYTGCM